MPGSTLLSNLYCKDLGTKKKTLHPNTLKCEKSTFVLKKNSCNLF